MVRMLRNEPNLSELFTAHLLARTLRVEEDLVDQLFNSSEKRLARALLLLANFGSGLIEAGTSAADRDARELVFRGINAAASLKRSPGLRERASNDAVLRRGIFADWSGACSSLCSERERHLKLRTWCWAVRSRLRPRGV
jgi:hypothetical protein